MTMLPPLGLGRCSRRHYDGRLIVLVWLVMAAYATPLLPLFFAAVQHPLRLLDTYQLLRIHVPWQTCMHNVISLGF